MGSCGLRPRSVAPKLGKNSVQSMCINTGPVPSHTSKQLWGVINSMNPDPVADIIRNDQVIIDLWQRLLNKGGTSVKNQQWAQKTVINVKADLQCQESDHLKKKKNIRYIINPK